MKHPSSGKKSWLMRHSFDTSGWIDLLYVLTIMVLTPMQRFGLTVFPSTYLAPSLKIHFYAASESGVNVYVLYQQM